MKPLELCCESVALDLLVGLGEQTICTQLRAPSHKELGVQKKNKRSGL